MESEICYIFGAGERTDCDITLSPRDIVIAADGGFDYLKEIGLRADYVLGDFDSVLSYDLPPDCIRYPADKDDTDLMLAVKLGLEKNYREFVIYGGLGGRLDHTLANFQALTFLSKNGASGTLYGKGYAARVVTDNTIAFSKDMPENTLGNICSVLSLSDVSTDVTIQGLKYELNNADLTHDFPLGISNEFTGKKAFIHVNKGTIAVIWFLPD